MADGGEGTVDALVAACHGQTRELGVHDPLGRTVAASYGLLGDGRAVVELAAASGLPLLAMGERDPLETSTYGTGELIADALGHGCTDVSIALGGSATNDGGMGMMRALGACFLDEKGCELEGCGQDLAHVATVDLSRLRADVRAASFHVMCDVDNPLVGPDGAAAVFAPQKGATPEVVSLLDQGMCAYADALSRACGTDVRDRAGAGAAGGAGAACMALLGADMVRGVDKVLELVGFDRLLTHADVCVTGEGHLDSQSARGKVVSGVAAACARRGVPCVAIVGGADADAIATCGVDAVMPLPTGPMDVGESIARAAELYRLAADRVFSLISMGMGLR
jgi:glycerate kinase